MSEPTDRHAPGPSLAGLRVVVTRPEARGAKLETLLEDLGATVLAVPTIAIGDPDSFEALDAALRDLTAGAYDWVVFLSVSAVEQVNKRLRAQSFDVATMEGTRVAAVGGATEEALRKLGISTDLRPSSANAAAVAEAIGQGAGRVLIPRAADAPAKPVEALRTRGWRVDEVTAYRTVAAPPDARLEPVRRGEFDAVIFTSGSTVRGLAALVGPSEAGLSPDDAGGRKVACIGPVTAGVARELGFRVDAIATEQSAQGLVDGLAGLYSKIPSEG